MSIQNESKIKMLLSVHRHGTALLPKGLESLGISRDLQKSYRKNGWLESVGAGAFKRSGAKVMWQGGLYAIQEQSISLTKSTRLVLNLFYFFNFLG